MENSYKYFENRACKYYPCHEGLTEMNCLFCYCPLYHIKDCPGNPKFKESKGKIIKVCKDCSFPHMAENYDKVINILTGGH